MISLFLASLVVVADRPASLPVLPAKTVKRPPKIKLPPPKPAKPRHHEWKKAQKPQ
jgi:hypothetical protein